MSPAKTAAFTDGLRRITLGTEDITFSLRFSPRRRRLAVQVDAEGVHVMAPVHASMPSVHALLRQYADWILRQRLRWQQRQQQQVDWWSMQQVMLLGTPLTLTTDAATRRPGRKDGCLCLPPALSTRDAAEAGIIRWLRTQALADFTLRCHGFARQLGVSAPDVRLGNARGRWGSCTTAGRIRLHWRLIQAPPHWIDYVAAHEVSHLRHMNHSPAFWSTVESLVDDVAVTQKSLRCESSRYLWL